MHTLTYTNSFAASANESTIFDLANYLLMVLCTKTYASKGKTIGNVALPAIDSDKTGVIIISSIAAEIQPLVSHLDKIATVRVCRIVNNASELMQIPSVMQVKIAMVSIQLLTAECIQALHEIHPTILIIGIGQSNQSLDATFEKYIFSICHPPFLLSDIFTQISAAQAYLVHASTTNKTSAKEYIFIKSEYKLIRVHYSNILFVGGMKDYIQLYIKGRSTPLTTLQNLKDFEKKLPNHQFIRVHRSYIAAIQHIDCIAKNELSIGSYSIPVGDAYKETLYQFIESYT